MTAPAMELVRCSEWMDGWTQTPDKEGFWWNCYPTHGLPVLCYLKALHYIGPSADDYGVPTGELECESVCGPTARQNQHLLGRDPRRYDSGYWRRVEPCPKMPTYAELLNAANHRKSEIGCGFK